MWWCVKESCCGVVYVVLCDGVLLWCSTCRGLYRIDYCGVVVSVELCTGMLWWCSACRVVYWSAVVVQCL